MGACDYTVLLNEVHQCMCAGNTHRLLKDTSAGRNRLLLQILPGCELLLLCEFDSIVVYDPIDLCK